MQRLVVLMMLVTGATGCGDAAGPSPDELLFSDTFLNIAHRGGRGENPEHTLLAYERALENGADVLELDVHGTSDGILVVMHDDTVDRTTDGAGAVKEMTFAEIRTLDAGYNFTTDDGATFPFRGMGLTVPTLEEVLQTFPDVPYVLEIKQETPPIVEAFAEIARTEGVLEQMVAASFSQTILESLRAVAPEMETSLAVDEVISFIAAGDSYMPPGQFLQVPTMFSGIEVLGAQFLANRERFDMKVHVWTINDADVMNDLVDLGVDGIITDYPTRLAEVLAARAEP